MKLGLHLFGFRERGDIPKYIALHTNVLNVRYVLDLVLTIFMLFYMLCISYSKRQSSRWSMLHLYGTTVPNSPSMASIHSPLSLVVVFLPRQCLVSRFGQLHIPEDHRKDLRFPCRNFTLWSLRSSVPSVEHRFHDSLLMRAHAWFPNVVPLYWVSIVE